MGAEREITEDILSGRLEPRVGLECLLLVSRGVRPGAIVTVPAELPDGEVLGAQVDYEFRARLAGQAQDLKTRLTDAMERRRKKPLEFKAYVLRSAFENNVMSSASYFRHREAVFALGLDLEESEVRPTIREWYVHRREDRPRVLELLRRRREIQRARTQFDPSRPVSYYVYPEERDPEYLRSLGRLLGYPECCIEAYVAGREAAERDPEAIPERRAARQLESESAEPEAYWLKDFFPCRPACPAARAKGREALAALAAADARLGDLYREHLGRNLARVRAGPELIQAHEEWLRRR